MKSFRATQIGGAVSIFLYCTKYPAYGVLRVTRSTNVTDGMVADFLLRGVNISFLHTHFQLYSALLLCFF